MTLQTVAAVREPSCSGCPPSAREGLYVRLRRWWRDRYLLKLSREYSYTLQQLWAVTKVELKK